MSLCPQCARFHADADVIEYCGELACPQCRQFLEIREKLKKIYETLKRMEEQNGKEDTGR